MRSHGWPSLAVLTLPVFKVRDGKVIGTPKLTDSFQLPWAGYDYAPGVMLASGGRVARVVEI